MRRDASDPTAGFTPLPHPVTRDGRPRKVGVEIELGGLDEERVARLCSEVLGGEPVQKDSAVWAVEGTELGDLKVYLDTGLRDAQKTRLRDLMLDLGREMVPVEIVTEPLDPDDLPRLEELVLRLRQAGALGSGSGWFFGFGVHLNVEIRGSEAGDIVPVLLAYALIEDWLRLINPIDESRRLLPFTDPYPNRVVRALCEAGPEATLDQVIRLYLLHTPTRNRGLDMLPVFAHLAPERVRGAVTGATSPRPAYHFRLPDCRIDEEAWSLADEWQSWWLVERVADDRGLLRELCAARLAEHWPVTLDRGHWARRVGEILKQSGVP